VVVEENGVCRLTDYENDILGLTIVPTLANITYPHVDKVDPIVIAFGAVLYEMAVGYNLDSHNLDDLPNSVAPKIRKVCVISSFARMLLPRLQDA
jgi:hypothetical protein